MARGTLVTWVTSHLTPPISRSRVWRTSVPWHLNARKFLETDITPSKLEVFLKGTDMLSGETNLSKYLPASKKRVSHKQERHPPLWLKSSVWVPYVLSNVSHTFRTPCAHCGIFENLWTGLFPKAWCLIRFYFIYVLLKSLYVMQTVYILIRRRILIWVRTDGAEPVCVCVWGGVGDGSQDKKWLKQTFCSMKCDI